MKYLLIENEGEITEDALILMGGSTKREDPSKIGHFGSGNKYTIAALLRKNIKFVIYGGLNELKVETQEYKYKDTLLDKIYINGKETSLTIQMGPDWKEVWMCIREWVQNAKDEGSMNIIPNIEKIDPREGKTRCYIEINSEVESVINNWDNYFTFDRTDILFDNKHGKIFSNTSTKNNLILFSKGIKCSDFYKVPSLYHYDADIEMNESRIIKSEWRGKEIIGNLLASCTDKNIIYTFLKRAATENMYESNVWANYLSIETFTKEWKEVLKNKRLIIAELAGWYMEEQKEYDCLIVKNDFAVRINNQFPDIIIYGLTDTGKNRVPKKEIELDSKKQFLLKECDRFLKECQYSIDYPIKVVKFNNSEIFGLAENNTIYISEKCFDMGKKEIARVLIEENEHLKTGHSDLSRAFQNHWINLFISEKEERFGFFL